MSEAKALAESKEKVDNIQGFINKLYEDKEEDILETNEGEQE